MKSSHTIGSKFAFLQLHKANKKMEKSYQTNAPQQPETTDKTTTESGQLITSPIWNLPAGRQVGTLVLKRKVNEYIKRLCFPKPRDEKFEYKIPNYS